MSDGTHRWIAAFSTACVVLASAGTSLAADNDPHTVTTEQIRAVSDKACEGGKQFTIAFSHPVSEAAIVKQVRRFADERAAELGCVTVMHDNTQHNNLEQQINAIQGWITQGVSAIVVSPIDITALKPFAAQAHAQNIKWLTYSETMEGADGFVGFDHVQSGDMIAKAAIDWVKANNIENPKALVTTLKGLPSHAPRWTEVEKLFGEAGINIVAEQDSADQVSGMTITETVLKQHPDLNIVIGLNDDAAVGANRAVKIAGLDPAKVFIGGQDGSLEGLTAVNEGEAYKASSAILINELGANIVNLAVNAVNGNGPSFAYSPTVLATKSDQTVLDRLISAYDEKK